MIKGLFLGLLLTTATGTCVVRAQSSDSDNAGPASRPTDTGLLNKNYLTPTGETVPRPRESQVVQPRSSTAGLNNKTTE